MREFLIIPFLLMLAGCSGRHSDLTVQLCLHDPRGVDEFKRVLDSVAQERGMEFVDGSVSTANKLKAMNQQVGYELVHVGISGKNGIGLTAGNQGLSAYDVAIGFFAGASKSDAQEFESAVIQALDERWQVHQVPAGQGAFPLEDCGSTRR